MSYKVVATARFEKMAKRLAKKFPSLISDLTSLLRVLSATPAHGTPLGKNVDKIRLAIASKGKGKSGGTRVISYVHISAETVYLLAIYDKSEVAAISDREILRMLGDLP
ncbi:MAG: type II toxin-antitoxin system RelE/ParE family toxin [Bacteroidetes bacterium]|nr:type II toxin-antitoxin system RelE/ParE family toxin [Bacteroidota bacterium]